MPDESTENGKQAVTEQPQSRDQHSDVDWRLRATASHEAGHAVMAHSLGRLVHKVSIAPGKSSLGTERLGVCKLQSGRAKASRDELEEEVLISLAGMVAESQLTGEYCHAGASEDLQHVQQLIDRRATSQKQFERLYRRMLAKTEHVLTEPVHQRALKMVTEELMQKTTISGRAIRHFFRLAQQESTQEAYDHNQPPHQ